MLQYFKENPPIQEKSFSNPNVSFVDFLQEGGNFDLAAHAAITLYKKAIPFFNAVDIRARNFSQTPIQVFNKKDSDWVPDHPVLKLLKRPNAAQTGMKFLYEMSSFFDITGNSFLMLTGRVIKEPLEMFNIRPQDIDFGTEKSPIFPTLPKTISITSNEGQNTIFYLEEVRTIGVRYVSRDKSKELWHISQFNPTRTRQSPWGLSRAQPAWLELQQYLSGNQNNLGQLKRGTRLSMAWVNNRGEELTDKQWARMEEQANKYRGSSNAGGTPILDGMDVKTIQATNRDMEFKDLQEQMFSRISIQYGIPLPMITNSASTFNNLETSQLQLWDNALSPLCKYLYAELTQLLMPRYENSSELELRFNEKDIPALRGRLIETTRKQAEIQINSIDELRNETGYESLEEGGEVVLRPSTQVPIGSDGDTSDQSSTAADKFIRMMEEVKDSKGDRVYSDDYILELAREKGLCH